MKYHLDFSGSFKRDYKNCKKRGYNILLLKETFQYLGEEGRLPTKYKAHKLTGNYSDCWECHIKPDWLLIWKINRKEHIIELVRTGTHADLF